MQLRIDSSTAFRYPVIGVFSLGLNLATLTVPVSPPTFEHPYINLPVILDSVAGNSGRRTSDTRR